MPASSPNPLLQVRDLSGWREWLAAHHASERVVWLYFRKGGVPAVTYDDALDEALCWGWIDSIIRRIDAKGYARKFTPRTNATKWSDVNVGRLRELMNEKRVLPAGLAVIASEVLAKIKGKTVAASVKAPKAPKAALPVPPELSKALAASAKASAFFESLAPSYRRTYCGWVAVAKQAETRARRAKEAVRLLARGVKSLLK